MLVMLQCPLPVLYIGSDVYVLLSYNHLPIVSIEFRKSISEVYHSNGVTPALDNYEPVSVDLYFQTQCIFLYTYEFS